MFIPFCSKIRENSQKWTTIFVQVAKNRKIGLFTSGQKTRKSSQRSINIFTPFRSQIRQNSQKSSNMLTPFLSQIGKISKNREISSLLTGLKIEG